MSRYAEICPRTINIMIRMKKSNFTGAIVIMILKVAGVCRIYKADDTIIPCISIESLHLSNSV